MKNNFADNAVVFKALADENRLKIFELLRQGEKCGNELLDAVNVSQSTLSHHMKVMCASGIVKSRKDKTWTYYSISAEGAAKAQALLIELTGISPERADEENSEASPAKNIVQHGSRPSGWLL